MLKVKSLQVLSSCPRFLPFLLLRVVVDLDRLGGEVELVPVAHLRLHVVVGIDTFGFASSVNARRLRLGSNFL